MAKKLDYKIDISIFDDLVKIQKSLPQKAQNTSQNSGYEDPAGLALLGMKDGILNTISPLKPDGGCWDLPGVTFSSMDKSLRDLLKKGCMCIGMALIRNLNWSKNREHHNCREGTISNDLKRHIQGFKKSFEDIEKTVWITLSGEYFRTYRVYQDRNNIRKFNIRETKAKTIYTNDSEGKILKGKFEKEKSQRLERKRKREEQEREKERQASLIQEQLELRERRKEEARQQNKNKLESLDKEIKTKEKDRIDLGNGQYLLKNKYGKYILWQV